LNKAYILKESYASSVTIVPITLRVLSSCGGKNSQKWRPLEPYRKYENMIENHWDGIDSYCHSNIKDTLGQVDGVNKKY
jgi:predicted SnoaL-like aldol condensation-catalyzing enzyme